jgi:predicted Zn-dependent protease
MPLLAFPDFLRQIRLRPLRAPLLLILAALAADKAIYYGLLPLANYAIAQTDYAAARLHFARGQNQPALDSIRAALLRTRTDPSCWRLAAKISARLDSPETTYCWQQLDRLVPGNFDTQIKLAESALHYRRLALATTALDEVADSNQAAPAFLRTAAQLADACGDKARAHDLFSQLETEHSNDSKTLLALANWHAESADPAELSRSEAILLPLIAQPNFRPDALRLLVTVSLKSGHRADAQKWSDQLLTTEPSVTDRVQRLDILQGPALESALADLMSNPQNLVPVATWMVAHGRAEEALIWIRHKSESIQNDPAVGCARADCLSALGLWDHLRDIQAADSWPGHAPQRLMYLARACEECGSEPDARAAWQKALLACRDYPDYLLLLDYLSPLNSRAAAPPFWTDARAQVWTRLITLYPNQGWVARSLLQYALAHHHSLEAESCWAQLAAIDPSDTTAAASAALISLLRNDNPEKASATLSRLSRDHPSEAVVATAEAYDLYRQGKFADALAALGALSPDQLHAPERAVYLGALLAIAGPIDQARAILPIASADPALLDEENALANRSWDFIHYREAIATVLNGPSSTSVFPALLLSENPSPLIFSIGQSVELIRSGHSDDAAHLLAQVDLAALDPAALTIYLGGLLELLGQSQAALPNLQLSSDLPYVSTAEQTHHLLELWWKFQAVSPQNPAALTGLFTAYRELDLCESDPAFWLRDAPRQVQLVRFALLHKLEISAAQDRLHGLLGHVPFTPEIQSQVAYALFLQGRGQAARERMEILAPADLARPEPALYYGLILAASGERQAAAPYLRRANSPALLPEQRALLVQAGNMP